jgi:hypothetical protein
LSRVREAVDVGMVEAQPVPRLVQRIVHGGIALGDHSCIKSTTAAESTVNFILSKHLTLNFNRDKTSTSIVLESMFEKTIQMQ